MKNLQFAFVFAIFASCAFAFKDEEEVLKKCIEALMSEQRVNLHDAVEACSEEIELVSKTFPDTVSDESAPEDPQAPVTSSYNNFGYRFGARGCTIPGGLPNCYKATFHKACNTHAICYFYKSRPRRLCDVELYSNMDSDCRSVSNPALCRKVANAYYRSLRAGGASYYGPQGYRPYSGYRTGY